MVMPALLVKPASAESLQGRVLAGRSVQAEAAGKNHGVAPGAAGQAAPSGAEQPSGSAAAQPAAGEAARTDLVLGPESGIVGVRVTLADAGDPKSVFATRTGPDGRFSLDGLPAGLYRVAFTHAVLGQRTMQAIVGKGAGEVVFVWETVPGPPPGGPLPGAARP